MTTQRLKGRHIYLGRSAQLVVMSELIHRGYNLSVPEVDVGDDLLVGPAEMPTQQRVQVKSCRAMWHRGGPAIWGAFRVPADQLLRTHWPALYYVFSLRAGDHWEHVIISREELLPAIQHDRGNRSLSRFGSAAVLLIFEPHTLRGLGRDFQPYRNNWDRYWPQRAGSKPSGKQYV